ncbi:MAG: scpB [Parcubacteria group bacterium]|nr:scpB [Parcubacteria group bacterium]
MALPHSALLEAVLFAAGEPLNKARTTKLLGLSDGDFADAVIALATALEGRGLALIETEKELELRTAPGAADTIKALRESELSRDLGKASLETLAMILYRGSATRSEIDWVRGVNSAAAIRSLTLRGLIERGEDATDKRRARYTATVDALAHLGVSKKEDLPRYEEFTTTIAAEERKGEEDANAI